MHRTGRLGEDRLVGGATATTDGAAATVEQPEPRVAAFGRGDERTLGPVELPLRGRDAAVLVLVGVADHYLVDAARAVPVPDSIGDEMACQMVSMPLSAKMILHSMGAKAGDWVIQNAANGAVGKMVAQFAADQGINVISLVRRAAGVEELAKVGIDNVVATDQPDWQAAVEERTKGAPIRYGIDSIGGPASDEILNVMGEGSALYSFGALTGRPLEISAANLLFKQARVEGFWLGKLMQTTPRELVGRMIGEIVTKAASGALKLDIGGRFGLAEAGKACAASDVPGRPGKIVLVP